jgi:hypothetical protein
VFVYLHHLNPVLQRIPDDNTDTTSDDPAAIETACGLGFGGYAEKK